MTHDNQTSEGLQPGAILANLGRIFIYSAGALLLASAMVIFVGNLEQARVFSPSEPMFKISVRTFLWIVGGAELAIALICLFTRQVSLQLTLVLWFAMNLVLYRMGLDWIGITGGVEGYAGQITDAFGLSGRSIDAVLKITTLYLLAGGCLQLLWLWAKGRSGKRFGLADSFLKITCDHCGQKIWFSINNLNQTISCPQCNTVITLCKPEETLKMTCVLCGGHIEFPAHTLGQKICCPHCAKNITLLKPA